MTDRAPSEVIPFPSEKTALNREDERLKANLHALIAQFRAMKAETILPESAEIADGLEILTRYMEQTSPTSIEGYYTRHQIGKALELIKKGILDAAG
ncbi:hypothetical protein [Roseibium aggregatum]|uniref:Uncharacterized protein n=1 Tax=Roseibium aggregatum TaxID=187304 RepID=A0A939EHU7_9HYPH|nr:hypothetical protein [Roseibium aggregatum]MBN9672981.1 hypothetical protein [Roseibium aggregatum]